MLVLRINRDDALRPVFVQLTARFSKEKRSIFWAPIRMPGSTRSATRDELSALFVEQRRAQPTAAGWDLPAPGHPAGHGRYPALHRGLCPARQRR